MNLFLCAAFFLLVSGEHGPPLEEQEDIEMEDPTPQNSTSNFTLIFTKSLKNITLEPGVKILKLMCEVQNLHISNDTKVTFTWKKNNAYVERSKTEVIKMIKLKDQIYRSVLKLVELNLFTKGFYECIATNGIDEIRSEGVVIFPDTPTASQQPIKFVSDPSSTSPSQSLVFDQRIAKLSNKEVEQAIKSGQLESTFDLTSNGHITETTTKEAYNSNEPLCQLYTGNTCKDYLKNEYVFVQPPYNQKDIEQKLIDAFLVISQSNDISSYCNKFAYPSLCYSAFPLCLEPHKIDAYQTYKMKKFREENSDFKGIRNELGSSLRRICKDDCLLLETELCSREYAIAKRHPVIGQTLELEECNFLPNDTEASSKHCLGLLRNRFSVNPEEKCFNDDGRSYKGVENVTETGNPCMRWSHQFHVLPSQYPELSGHNYCRNPGGLYSQPFCFVNTTRKELCHVPKCAHIVGIYILAGVVGLAACSGLLIGVFCCRRKRINAHNLQNMSTPTADKNIYGNAGGPNSPMEMNNLLPPNIPPQRSHHSSKIAYQSVPQYTYKEVAFVEELGEGAFGKVYKGELKMKTGKLFVAVKSLKENASAKTQADFQREIELISELKHPNIICLMGVVMKQEPMCMLFEFMSEGDLHEFLICNSPGEGKSLTQNQFLHIAIQIAQGMEYLSENHYVHRDLAARNCLVSSDLIVKISDFGLSRDMYSCDYYRVQSKSLLPVRWMPPESILYGKFTTESDVWSYGVVLWEIYSYGLQPYYGYNNQEVINMIRSRKLLPCPDACPSYCYALMVECWAELAIRRPSFGEISHRLRVWKQNGNSNGAYFRTPPPDLGYTRRPGEASDLEHKRFTASQSSLTSRSSSLGNKTQSTSLSNEGSRSRRHRRHEDSLSLDRQNPKNTVVSSKGENVEIKITH